MPKGQFIRSEAHKRAISEALKGKKKSAEHNQHNSESHIGTILSPEHRQKLSDAMRAADHPNKLGLSEGHKQKLSQAKMGRSSRLVSLGISADEYERQIKAGNRWCTHGKHFETDDRFPSKQPVCIACRSEFYREADLRRKYKVTHEWYVQKLAEQDGKCAICKRSDLSKGDNHFAVDHNHETGAVRGLLCTPCNSLVGAMERVPDCFMAIATYLARYR